MLDKGSGGLGGWLGVEYGSSSSSTGLVCGVWVFFFGAKIVAIAGSRE